MFDFISYSSEFSISEQNLKAQEKHTTVLCFERKQTMLWLASCAGSLCPEEESTAASADKVCAALSRSSVVTAHSYIHSSMQNVCIF